jgi:hypothetical protein
MNKGEEKADERSDFETLQRVEGARLDATPFPS